MSVSPLTIRKVEPRRGAARRTAGRTEHGDLPGIADPHADGTAVANESRQRVRQMMQVQDGIGDAAGCERAKDAVHQRYACNRKRRLGAHEREWTKPRGQTGRQYERWDHSSANIMLAPSSPN